MEGGIPVHAHIRTQLNSIGLQFSITYGSAGITHMDYILPNLICGIAGLRVSDVRRCPDGSWPHHGPRGDWNQSYVYAQSGETGLEKERTDG